MNLSGYGNITSTAMMLSDNGVTTFPSDVLTNASVEVNSSTVAHIWVRHSWPEFLGVHRPVVLRVDRYITPIWYLIGIIGNLLSAKIWLEKRMRLNNSSAIYLATLSVTDMIFLMLHILQELKYAWDVDTLNYPVICEGYFLFYLVAQYLSPMLVLGFTVERYIAVCHPFQKEKYCTTSRAMRVVLLFIAISIVLCAMQAYFWMYNHDLKSCMVRPAVTEGEDKSLWSIWTWITEMLIFLLIPLVILSFNILVIREVRKLSDSGQTFLPGQVKQTHSASRATTLMLLSVSFYVIFTTLPATIVYAMFSAFPEGDPYLPDAKLQLDPVWTQYLDYITSRKIVEEICLSHYACNFFLYLITGVHFRKSLLEFLHCKMYKNIKSNGKYSEISQRATWQNTHVTKV